MRHEKRGNINFYNGDNMEFMKNVPDKFYDLAIIDPPYGIDVANDSRFGKKSSSKAATKTKDYTKKDWDLGAPTTEFWDELFRVSKNQIVWGVNYFADPRLCGGRIFWDKEVPEDYTKSKGEIAYRSTGVRVDYIKVTWHGMLQYNMKDKEVRIYPTQKPIMLYRWLLQNYAKQGMKILDTHGGSMTIARACDMEGYALDIIEIDKDYFNDGLKAFDNYKRQLTLF